MWIDVGPRRFFDGFFAVFDGVFSVENGIVSTRSVDIVWRAAVGHYLYGDGAAPAC
jgi:hypothetical protein